MQEQYMTSYEVLKTLKITKPTLYRLVNKGIIRRSQMKGLRKYAYNKADVLAVIDEKLIEEGSGLADWVAIRVTKEDGKRR